MAVARDIDGRDVDRFNEGPSMIPHVKDCRCEACLEGRTVQHVAGCLCDGCKAREAAFAGTDLGGILRGIGGRVEKVARAASAVKDVLTPHEREAVIRFLRGKP